MKPLGQPNPNTMRSWNFLHPPSLTYFLVYARIICEVLRTSANGYLGISGFAADNCSWGLGCCIPDEVIGTDGYISKYQTRIQSLSLTTDGTCKDTLRDYSGLLDLRQLRHLSWKGLDFGSKARILRQLLGANHDHLESLELETFQEDHPLLHLYDVTGDPVVTADATHFPALRHLILSGISLSGAYERMNLAYPLEELHSLRIRDCFDGLNLLFAMARVRKDIKLRCLEVVYTEQRGDEVFNRVHPIDKFLKSFKGLEELYISLRHWTPHFRDLHRSILHHKGTLKRLVHHEREWDLNPRSERNEYLCDRKTPWFRSIDDMLGKMWLECIGVTIPPLYLVIQFYDWLVDCFLTIFQKEKFGTSARLTSLKLLHLRITASHYDNRDLLRELKAAGYSPEDGVINSGNAIEIPRQTTPNGGPIRTSLECKEFICMKDLLKFVQWAFGPKGFSKLSVLAYGDFSHNTRFKWSQFLFCRADPTRIDKSLISAGAQPATFRIMTHADEDLLERIKGSREFLSACPVEAILDPDDGGDGAQETWFDPYTNGFRPYVRGVTGVGLEGFGDEDEDDSVDSLEAEMLNDGFDYGFDDQYNDEDVDYIDNAEYSTSIERNINITRERDADDFDDAEYIEDARD